MVDTIAYAPLKRPRLALLGSERWRAAREYVAHKVAPAVRRAPGDGHPVILFPGLGTSAGALVPWCERCRLPGYNAFDWGRGYNTAPQGDLDTWLEALAAHVDGLLAPFERSATLIGWSHTGIGWNRALLAVIADRLAQPVCYWRLYVRQ